jgi:type IVB pilus formation R64 PilN family outer membrane protein
MDRTLFKKTTVALVSATITVLIGCAPQNLKDYQSNMMNTSLDKLNSVGDHDVSLVNKVGFQYIGSPKDGREYVEPMPHEFDGNITMTVGPSLTFAGLANEIYQAQVDAHLPAIPVVVMPQLNSAGLMGAPAPAATSSSTPQASNQQKPAELAGINFDDMDMPSNEVVDFDTSHIQPYKYINVPFKKMLNDIAATNNLAWRYANGKIVIYRYLTKTVRMNAIPGAASMVTTIRHSGNGAISTGGGSSMIAGSSAGGAPATGSPGSVTGGGSSGASQGSLAQSTTLDADKLDIWDRLVKTIPNMLSRKGVVTVNPPMGTVTIRDEPVVVEEVSRYLAELNTSMAKQLAIDVNIYMVNLNENSEVGINYQAAFLQGNKNFGITGASMVMPQVAAGSAVLSFLIPETATNPELKRFSGSQLLINALSSVGTITNRYSIPVRTQNLQPVQVNNQIQEVFLSSTGAALTPNVGTATSTVPGILTTGLTLAVLPHVLDNNDLVLQYGLTISAKSGMRTVPTGNGTNIEAPTVGGNSFAGRSQLRSGQTLVLSGLEQLTMNLTETGNFAAGGGWTKTGQHVVMVLTITPRLETAANDSATRLASTPKTVWPFEFIKNPEDA